MPDISGYAYKMDSSIPGKSTGAFFSGLAVNSANPGEIVKARIVGVLGVYSDLVTGNVYFLSTDGGISNSAGSIAIGIALSSTQLLVNSLSVQTTNVPVGGVEAEGYILGGLSSTTQSTADKITYSTDINLATTSANLSQARYNCCGISYYSGYSGYVSGGNTGARVTTTDKTTYTTDVTASNTSANLSTARESMGGVSNNYGGVGYFSGGTTGANVASTEKLNYSSETTSSATGANLSQARQSLAGLSSEVSGKGYMVGGFLTNSTCDKITYSTETAVSKTSANLSQGRFGLAGISNDRNGKGYVCGGSSDNSVGLTLTDKTVYSSDTTASQTSANLSQGRFTIAGVSANLSDKGYVCGGVSSGGVTVATTDKLTYSTETTVAQTSANLSQARSSLSSLSGNSV